MLRKLFTLLAVISGLTLSTAQVQAAPAAAVAVAQLAERADCVVLGTRPLQLIEVKANGPSTRRPCERTVAVVPVPTIMLQADRARE